MDKFYQELSEIECFKDFLIKRLDNIRKAISDAVAKRDWFAACELNGRINELDEMADKVNRILQLKKAKNV